MKIKNVILDLDETLISSIEISELKINPEKHKEFKKRSRLFKYYILDDDFIVFERPGVQAFLDFLFEKYNVSVWTAASKDYALFVIEKVVLKNSSRKLDYVLFSEHCDVSRERTGCLKQLNQLFHLRGYNSKNTVIIDDNKNVLEKQSNTVLAIKPFNFFSKNSEHDNQLLKIRKKLI